MRVEGSARKSLVIVASLDRSSLATRRAGSLSILEPTRLVHSVFSINPDVLKLR